CSVIRAGESFGSTLWYMRTTSEPGLRHRQVIGATRAVVRTTARFAIAFSVLTSPRRVSSTDLWYKRTMVEKSPNAAAVDERYPYLDGWRGLAILLVLIAHYWHVRVPVIGRMGVDLFFVLSGLLMSHILFEKRMPIAKFYRRRISRILPVFLLFVATAWIGWSHRGASWQELVTTLTFTRTYYTHPMILHSLLPAQNLWSLN